LFVFFGQDVTEPPLALDGAVRVFYNGLSSAVVFFVLFYPFFVVIDIMLVFTALDPFSVFCF
jgi:hypothetical protein